MAILIDTSAWVEALGRAGNPTTRHAVRAAVVDGEAPLCELVLLELWNGARGKAEIAMLRGPEAEVERLPMTAEVWLRANEIARALRAGGVTVPATDVAIAACALHHGATLLHRDEDFDRIEARVR